MGFFAVHCSPLLGNRRTWKTIIRDQADLNIVIDYIDAKTGGTEIGGADTSFGISRYLGSCSVALAADLINPLLLHPYRLWIL